MKIVKIVMVAGAKAWNYTKNMCQMWWKWANKSSKTNSFWKLCSTITCDKCGGTGKIIDEPCKTCQGKGKKEKRKIKVNIPAGVDTGNVMPLRGQGEHGDKGWTIQEIYI